MSVKAELIGIVGFDYVTDAADELEKFSRDESFVRPIAPKCLVRPGSAEEVQRIVQWSNKTLTPLVPVSSGSPHFRGDTVPGTAEAVIVDLRRMNRIIRIDAENRIAMVEPGVTFGDLISEVEKKGLRLNMPLLPRATKSVVGSLLEREPVIMPAYHWDISDPLACTEIVYGTGDLFRTGSAVGPGTLEEQWEAGSAQTEAAGPLQADFYRLIQGAQGTMGIVTWVTVRCERMPKIQEPYLVGSSHLNDLLELTHWLIRRRLVDECLILNNYSFASILRRHIPSGNEKIGEPLPQWLLFYCVAGYRYFPEERVKYQLEAVTEISKRLGLAPAQAIGGESADKILKMFHEPSEEPYWKLRPRGSCYDIFFVTDCDALPGVVSAMYEMADKYDFPVANMGAYIQPMVQGVNYHCEFNLFFDRKNASEAQRVAKLPEEAFTALSSHGAFFSRPYGPWAHMAYRGDAPTTTALRKVKQIFDPNNIMNPGKLCF